MASLVVWSSMILWQDLPVFQKLLLKDDGDLMKLINMGEMVENSDLVISA